MPVLSWATKSFPDLPSSALEIDSIIYPQGVGYPDAIPHDRLIWGDNLAVMAALLPEYRHHIDLIYADPPFFTNKHYPVRIGRNEDSRRPKDWKLVEGYPDHWTDIDSYLEMLYPRLRLMYDLLAPTGTLYLHLDWHANSYARILLDEIFGPQQLLNEIIWIYHGPSPIRSAFNRKHDTILVYTKGDKYTFNVDTVRQPYNPQTVKTFASSTKAGFGKIPNLERGKVPEDWWYYPVVARLHNERTGYPTQKPEALLERIIRASSNPGDLVADFFCGSGTTAFVAARLERNFIASDVSFRAIHTTRVRLLSSTRNVFSIERQSGNQTIDQKASNSLRLELNGDLVKLNTPDLGEIDYWEIDPAWNGSLFRSAAQSVRPRRKGNLVDQLPLAATRNHNPLCARAIDIYGNINYSVLKPQE